MEHILLIIWPKSRGKISPLPSGSVGSYDVCKSKEILIKILHYVDLRINLHVVHHRPVAWSEIPRGLVVLWWAKSAPPWLR